MHEIASDSAWLCPNDRHLALRAKLRSGWSVRSGQMAAKNSPPFTPDELEKIRDVISKAAALEELEQERIGCLVQRLNTMRQNSMGDGKLTCILCAEQFGKFMGSAHIICMDCKRKVCSKCCVDYGTGLQLANGKQNAQQNQTTNWLCKICSENRELWKRSGAWFFQALPVYKLPTPSPQLERRQNRQRFARKAADSPLLSRKDKLALPESPVLSVKGHNRSLSGSSTGSFQWAKPTKPNFTSSSDGEESSDDDGITLGKQKKQNHLNLRSSDTLSLTSSTSVTSAGQQALSTGSSSVSRQGSGRQTLRGRRNPQVMVTGDGDETSLDSRTSGENSKLMVEMSRLHGGSNNSLNSYDAQTISHEKDPKGYIEFSILYDPLKCALHVEIIKAKNLIAMDSNGLSDPYVKLHLLPGITRANRNFDATKLRTKTVSKTLNPEFNETLTYLGILERELVARQLLITVLDEDRFGQDFLGEVIVPLKGLIASQRKVYNLPLNSQYALKEEEKQPADPGRIYLGLRYCTQDHYLSVKIHRCTGLVQKKKDHENVNPLIKATLTLDNHRSISHKTEVKKKSHNPVFDRELKFRVSPDNGQAELARGTLVIAVMHKDAIGHDTIGSIEFGINSGGDLLKHWFNCLKHNDQQFNNWHILSTGTSPTKKK